ncbi:MULTISPECIES: monovalent cation/H(+) antiporter subunit G [Cyclobacterium]|uniref:Monovalent cation/H(+) antiporter subunit G n=1 Tax=Cyclobacterium plantarum TaxID=2716263 RepID=A0ABX0HI63_9BACT|nr:MULTISPECIES: monovalent cation/H(+) antiporter subunit G [Cyclobacterium]MBD3627148.1 monovalent cation/H(+) antiporter subunit G [Cyclobacterium sp.]NHE59735.1 monovalent cation/H(+) antiporter subunit G [Cyclobacterium plantarum]
MNDYLIMGLSTLGAVFILLAAVGVVRMPDLYLRISVTTKAATLGIGLLLLAAGIYFNEFGIYSRVMAIILFMLLTAPVGAHMIGRASYFTGVKLWSGSKLDDLKGKYHPKSHELSSDNDQKKDENK